MHNILGTLDAGTAHEVTYEQDERGAVYECRPAGEKRFFCSLAAWSSTLPYAALEAQRHRMNLLDYLIQRQSLS